LNPLSTVVHNSKNILENLTDITNTKNFKALVVPDDNSPTKTKNLVLVDEKLAVEMQQRARVVNSFANVMLYMTNSQRSHLSA